jgi:hypothetical protein
MGKVYGIIDDRMREFIAAQRMFFVATAPSGSDGHVNVSPKGGTGSLAVLDERRVAYLDYTGSGAETIAHLRDNGRITVMFCAFDGPPSIVRLYGRGVPLLPGQDGFAALLTAFPAPQRGLRAIIDVRITRVSDSCGFQVPLMAYTGDRDLLVRWAGRKNDEELARYRATHNARSVDGLPALAAPPAAEGSDRSSGRAPLVGEDRVR